MAAVVVVADAEVAPVVECCCCTNDDNKRNPAPSPSLCVRLNGGLFSALPMAIAAALLLLLLLLLVFLLLSKRDVSTGTSGRSRPIVVVMESRALEDCARINLIVTDVVASAALRALLL